MFQSTHPHGVRPVEILYVQGGERFQSTHPHGVRPPYSIHYDFLLPVSIHAPTRGATGRYLPSGNIQLSFNPRTHTRCDSLGGLLVEKRGVSIHAPTRGATLRGLITTRLHLMFQSTHPHEVRLSLRRYVMRSKCFNPRTHTRCDSFFACISFGIYAVSIHAPTRGATVWCARSCWCN